MTTYRARNTRTGQTFLPRHTMTHAIQDYIDQLALWDWTVDILGAPEATKEFSEVFPQAISSRGTAVEPASSTQPPPTIAQGRTQEEHEALLEIYALEPPMNDIELGMMLEQMNAEDQMRKTGNYHD